MILRTFLRTCISLFYTLFCSSAWQYFSFLFCWLIAITGLYIALHILSLREWDFFLHQNSSEKIVFELKREKWSLCYIILEYNGNNRAKMKWNRSFSIAFCVEREHVALWSLSLTLIRAIVQRIEIRLIYSSCFFLN